MVFDGLLQPLPTMRSPITRVLNIFLLFSLFSMILQNVFMENAIPTELLYQLMVQIPSGESPLQKMWKTR